MSYFTVLVKVDAERLAKNNGKIGDAIAEILAPYQENNMGDCPDEYLAFNDRTEEVEEQANEVIAADSYYGKQHPDMVGKTYLEANDGDMDALVEVHFGYKKNEAGRYGYYENPNAKWDWYQVGGRWTGALRVKEMAVSAQKGEPSLLAVMAAVENGEKLEDDPHTADVARIDEIDFEGMDLEVGTKIEAFWAKWQRLPEVKKRKEEGKEPEGDDMWLEYDVMQTLQSLGLTTLVSEPEFNEDRKMVKPAVYDTQSFTLEDLKQNYRWYWEFGTWAVVDNDGWHEKGKMGWWGLNDATPEGRENWSKSYVDRFLRNEKSDTLLAVVDCHI